MFETKNVEEWKNYIFSKSYEDVRISGGGAYKYQKDLKENFGDKMKILDEFSVLRAGICFLVKEIPDNSFFEIKDG